MLKQRLQLTWYNKDKALIPTETGRYGYSWVDPEDPRYCETHFLEMDCYIEGKQTPKKEGVTYSEMADLVPQTDNLLINGESGDVLEALTRVPELSKKYLGQIKLIYIDPPFNTAQTFSSYEDNLEHSIWLTMMRDRLLHMKQLLSDDGSIWVHLDTSENHRMRVLLDEIFGSSNFVAEIVWGKADTSRNDAKQFSEDQDYIYVYSKQPDWRPNRLPRTAAQNSIYGSPDGDPIPWLAKPGHAPGAQTHQGMVYAIQSPFTGEMLYPPIGGCWRLGQDKMFDALNQWASYKLEDIHDENQRASICGVGQDEVRKGVSSIVLDEPLNSAKSKAEIRNKTVWPDVFFINNGSRIQVKGHLPEGGTTPRTIWDFRSVGSNRNSKAEIKALFKDIDPFSTPKPERLLERVIYLATEPGDIVFDCFAGSGTTAAVAQKMGRRWVTCELIENTFKTYTLPRLTMVVKDEDPGGITITKGERIPAPNVELPEGVTPDSAAEFYKVLNKLISEDDNLKSNEAIKALKSLSKTVKSKDIVNWRGGGGFHVARLSDACFDYDPILDRVVVTENGTGDSLIASVAANLGFELLKDASEVFDGKRGNTLLKIIDGTITPDLAEWLVAQTTEDNPIIIAATSVMDGTREALRRARKGSRVIAIPDEIFAYSKGGE